MSLKWKFLLILSAVTAALSWVTAYLLAGPLGSAAQVYGMAAASTVAAALAGYLCFTLVIADRLQRSLDRLLETANHSAAAAPAELGATDELAELARAVDATANRLAQTCASLQTNTLTYDRELNATLDAKAAIIDGALDAIIKLDVVGQILLFNPAAQRMFGCKQRAAQGKCLNRFVQMPTAGVQTLEMQLKEMVGSRCEVLGIRADGSRFPAELAVSRLPTYGVPAYAVFLRDLTEQKRLDAGLRLQLAITSVLATCPERDSLLRSVLETFCREADWQIGLFWQSDADQTALGCQQTLYLQSDEYGELETRLRELKPRRGAGMTGEAIRTHEAQWRADLAKEPDIDTTAARDAGLRASLCFPVVAQNRTLGVCQFFATQPREPQSSLLKLAKGIGAQLGLAIEREQTARSLAQSERRFRSFVAATSQIYWCANRAAEVLETHKAWEEFTGQTAAEAIGHGWMQAVRIDDMPSVAAAIEHALANDAQIEFRCHVRRHDGVYRLFAVRGVPVFDDDGVANIWAGTAEDIDDRWKAEQALVETAAQLGALFEGALDGMLIMDNDGRIVEANPAACRVLGRTRDELLVPPMFDMLAPGHRGPAVWRHFLRRGSMASEFCILRPDGTQRTLEFQAIAHVQPGKHLSIFRDITERRQADSPATGSATVLLAGSVPGEDCTPSGHLAPV